MDSVKVLELAESPGHLLDAVVAAAKHHDLELATGGGGAQQIVYQGLVVRDGRVDEDDLPPDNLGRGRKRGSEDGLRPVCADLGRASHFDLECRRRRAQRKQPTDQRTTKRQEKDQQVFSSRAAQRKSPIP